MYNSLLAIDKLRYIHGAAVAKIGYSSISAFATRPGRHLIALGGSVLGLLLLSYTHILHTYITKE